MEPKRHEEYADASSTMAFGWARENARYYLKSAIDEEVDNLDDITPQTWKIATHNVVKRLKGSSQMSDLIEDVKKRLKIYSGNTCLHVDNRTQPVPIHTLKPMSNLNKWGATKLETTRPKHQQQLAEDISHNLPLKVRIEAFRNLLNSHLPTVVSSDSWPLLQKNLVESLCDSNSEIFYSSLQMHVKLLASTTEIMKEGFLSLIDGLRTHYSRKYHKFLPNYDEGLDLTNPVHKRIIRISHLLLETAKNMTENWLRIGEKIIEEIMNVFLALISMHTYESMYSKNILYPFHIFAALDPRAKWCLHWVYCGFGRNIFLSLQSRIVTLLRYIVEEIDQFVKLPLFMKNSEVQESISKETKLIYSVNIKLSVFSLCVNILCIVLPYKKARMFFPLQCKIQNEPLPFSDVLVWLVEYLNLSYNNKNLNYNFITDALITFFKCRECPLSLFPEVIHILLKPMESSLGKEVESNCRIPMHSVYILEAICSTEKGVAYLVECSNFKNRPDGPYQIDTPPNCERNCNYVSSILNYTDLLLNQTITNNKPLIKLLEISSKLIKYLDFTLLFVPVTMIENIIIQFLLLHEQFKPKFSHSEINYVTSSSEDLFCSLSFFLGSVISWPGGCRAVLQCSNIIEDFIPSLFAYHTVLWESPDFCRLLFMLTTLPEAEVVLAIECKKSISEALQNLWKILEDQESFVKGTERDSRRASIRFMNIVYNFTSTLVGTKIFFLESDDSDETLLECACNPTSPVELINLDSSQDPWHKIALLTLQALTRNLDAWIYIESKYEIENRLLQLQSENIVSSVLDDPVSENETTEKDIIIDEYSVLRQKILSAVRVVCKSSKILGPGVKCESLCTYILENFPGTEQDVISENCSASQCELLKLIEDSEEYPKDKNWIIKLRKAFRTSKGNDLNTNTITILLEHVWMCDNNDESALNWQDLPTLDPENFTREEILGIEITLRYGVHDCLLDSFTSYDKVLGTLLLQTQCMLNVSKNKGSFKGFDWFLASVFLLCCGNLEKCHCFLNHFVSLPISLVLWPVLAERKGKQYIYLAFSSLVDWVTRKDVPLANAALQSCGISWGVLCYNWLSQCFWNILEWKQVCQWFGLCILYPPDVVVYFCAALLNYLQPRILEAASSGKVWDQIVGPFTCFTLTEHMSFIDKSIKQHRTVVLPKLLQIITV